MDGDGEVLMPGDGPVLCGGFVEEDAADGGEAGGEDAEESGVVREVGEEGGLLAEVADAGGAGCGGEAICFGAEGREVGLGEDASVDLVAV